MIIILNRIGKDGVAREPAARFVVDVAPRDNENITLWDGAVARIYTVTGVSHVLAMNDNQGREHRVVVTAQEQA